uniref:Uncharacterized protein n=1 Tax=Setaria italica TaxID=4555 RepID=K4AKV3_SETIT
GARKQRNGGEQRNQEVQDSRPYLLGRLSRRSDEQTARPGHDGRAGGLAVVRRVHLGELLWRRGELLQLRRRRIFCPQPRAHAARGRLDAEVGPPPLLAPAARRSRRPRGREDERRRGEAHGAERRLLGRPRGTEPAASRGAAAPLPVAIKDGSRPPAMGPVGVNGCFGEAKKVRPLVLEPLDVGVSGPSGEAANTKPPLGVGPVGVLGRSGAAKNANMFPALLASDPPGVVGAFSGNANMFPAAVVGWIDRSPGANENSAAAEDPARDAIGEGGGVGEGVGVREGGGGGVPGAGSKGASSSSILLRTEEAGRRQRRLRPASAAQGAEKATAECAGSMRSSARCRGAGGGVKKKGSSAMAMAQRGGGLFVSFCFVVALICFILAPYSVTAGGASVRESDGDGLMARTNVSI